MGEKSAMAQNAIAEAEAAVNAMKSGDIDAAEFYKQLMAVLANIPVTNEDLKGVTPQLLGFVNGLIRNLK